MKDSDVSSLDDRLGELRVSLESLKGRECIDFTRVPLQGPERPGAAAAAVVRWTGDKSPFGHVAIQVSEAASAATQEVEAVRERFLWDLAESRLWPRFQRRAPVWNA